MKKWNLVIDIASCHDCNNCFLACKDEYVENNFPPYSAAQPNHGHRWIDVLRKERGQFPKVDVSYMPLPCMHCDEADCIKAAANDAVYKRADGIVIIDPIKAKGQKAIVDSCPYGVIWWNEDLELPQKCTFCSHLLDDGWDKPRCVQVCPTGALNFMHLEEDEMQRLVETEQLEVLHPEYGLQPRVYYRNMYRYTKSFIAGGVALKEQDECAEGAQVTLKSADGSVIKTALTNNYGDFTIDGLEAKNGKYQLEITYSGYPKRELSLELEQSTDLGTIYL